MHRLAAVVLAFLIWNCSLEAAAQDTNTLITQRPYKLSELNRNSIPSLLENIKTKEQWAKKEAEIREVWLDYLGELPERPVVEYRIVSETQMKDHVRQKIIFNTIYDDQVTAYLLIPNAAKTDKKKYPAILALHPTHASGKGSVATTEGTKNWPYGIELVSREYIVLAPDDLTAGERIYPGQKDFYSAPFYGKYPNWTIMAKTLVDHMQALDLLTQHKSVAADRIGAIGHSFGGYNSFFLSSVDKRIKAVVSSCGMATFTGDKTPDRWGLRPRYSHFPRLSEDIKHDRIPFEFNEIMALSAPTPMFFYSGQSDHIFPHWQNIGQALVDVHKLYTWMGHGNRFVSIMTASGHDFPVEARKMSYDFLDKWLKN